MWRMNAAMQQDAPAGPSPQTGLTFPMTPPGSPPQTLPAPVVDLTMEEEKDDTGPDTPPPSRTPPPRQHVMTADATPRPLFDVVDEEGNVSISEFFKCIVCYCVRSNPDNVRHCRQCWACMCCDCIVSTRSAAAPNPAKCPKCRAKWDPSVTDSYVVLLKQMSNKLRMSCVLCNTIVTHADQSQHLEHCPLVRRCPLCKQLCRQHELLDHLKTDEQANPLTAWCTPLTHDDVVFYTTTASGTLVVLRYMRSNNALAIWASAPCVFYEIRLVFPRTKFELRASLVPLEPGRGRVLFQHLPTDEQPELFAVAFPLDADTSATSDEQGKSVPDPLSRPNPVFARDA